MAEAWDISDLQLREILQAYFDSIATGDGWNVRLFQNNYQPIPGTELSDFTEATFPGYGFIPINNADWGAVVANDNVASSTYPEPLEYDALPAGFVQQTIYGYYVTTVDDDYVYCERFEVPVIIKPGDALRITPIYRLRTYPYT